MCSEKRNNMWSLFCNSALECNVCVTDISARIEREIRSALQHFCVRSKHLLQENWKQAWDAICQQLPSWLSVIYTQSIQTPSTLELYRFVSVFSFNGYYVSNKGVIRPPLPPVVVGAWYFQVVVSLARDYGPFPPSHPYRILSQK